MVAKNLEIVNDIDNLNLGRALTLACFRHYKKIIKKATIPYNFGLFGKLMQREKGNDLTFNQYSSGLWNSAEELCGRARINPVISEKPRNSPFYVCAKALVEGDEGYAGIGKRVREASEKGIRGLEEVLDYVAKQS